MLHQIEVFLRCPKKSEIVPCLAEVLGDNHIIYIFQPPTCLRQVFIISKATDFIKLAARTGLY